MIQNNLILYKENNYGNREKPYYKKREDLKYNKYNPKRQEEDSSSSILNKIKFM